MRRRSPFAKAELWLAAGLSTLALGIGAAALAIGFLTPATKIPAPLSPTRLPIGHETDLDLRTLTEPSAAPKRPIVAIVIDDLGNNPDAARRAIALPPQVALAFLPYPSATPALAQEAEQAGHDVLVHVPMEAVGAQDAGPMVLRTDLPASENLRRLAWDLSRVPGYSGINNHEGSKFTADAPALAPLMPLLAGHHAFFFDSRTTAETQVVAVAESHGVLSAGRDVFLDDVPSASAIATQFCLLESKAKANGVAIAIGHPNPVTLDAVGDWARSEKSFFLVSLEQALEAKSHSLALARR